MADVLSVLASPFFDLVDLALDSPWAALGVVAALGVAVLVLGIATA